MDATFKCTPEYSEQTWFLCLTCFPPKWKDLSKMVVNQVLFPEVPQTQALRAGIKGEAREPVE